MFNFPDLNKNIWLIVWARSSLSHGWPLLSSSWMFCSFIVAHLHSRGLLMSRRDYHSEYILSWSFESILQTIAAQVLILKLRTILILARLDTDRPKSCDVPYEALISPLFVALGTKAEVTLLAIPRNCMCFINWSEAYCW